MIGKYVAALKRKSFILSKLFALMLDDSSTKNTMSALTLPHAGATGEQNEWNRHNTKHPHRHTPRHR